MERHLQNLRFVQSEGSGFGVQEKREASGRAAASPPRRRQKGEKHSTPNTQRPTPNVQQPTTNGGTVISPLEVGRWAFKSLNLTPTLSGGSRWKGPGDWGLVEKISRQDAKRAKNQFCIP